MVPNSLVKNIFGDFSTQISTNPINLDKFLHKISIDYFIKNCFTEIQIQMIEKSRENAF